MHDDYESRTELIGLVRESFAAHRAYINAMSHEQYVAYKADRARRLAQENAQG